MHFVKDVWVQLISMLVTAGAGYWEDEHYYKCSCRSSNWILARTGCFVIKVCSFVKEKRPKFHKRFFSDRDHTFKEKILHYIARVPIAVMLWLKNMILPTLLTLFLLRRAESTSIWRKRPLVAKFFVYFWNQIDLVMMFPHVYFCRCCYNFSRLLLGCTYFWGGINKLKLGMFFICHSQW